MFDFIDLNDIIFVPLEVSKVTNVFAETTTFILLKTISFKLKYSLRVKQIPFACVSR